MRRDARLSLALHVLLHMSDADRAITSETLGPMMKANPVALRRTLAGLREGGILCSQKGHGGGWSLARELGSVTLADVYEALGVSTPFNIGHRTESPKCPLERSVNQAVGETLAEAEALILGRFRSITVRDLLADARRKKRKREMAHA